VFAGIRAVLLITAKNTSAASENRAGEVGATILPGG
jgi:hypothetical protein